MKYSLCVLHYGSLQFTEECLRSSLSLVREPVERIVLWNDFQRDPRELQFSGARIVEPGDNLGFAGGGNAAIRAAFEHPEVESAWLLNNDTRMEPECSDRLLEVLEDRPRVAMVGPRILQYDTGRVWHDGGAIEWPSARPHSPGFDEPAAPEADPFAVDFVCGCAPLIRRQAFEEVGGFDERYFIFYEDADLSFRLRNAGWELLHVPRARFWHHGSAITGEGSPFSRYYRLRNRLLFSSQHAPEAEPAQRQRRRLRRKASRQAWSRVFRGRWQESRAIFRALSDARHQRWGKRWS